MRRPPKKSVVVKNVLIIFLPLVVMYIRMQSTSYWCNNYSWSEQSDSIEWEGKGQSEQKQEQWNVGRVSETE